MREDLIYWRYQVEERLSDCWFLSRKILSIFSGWGELHHARCHKVSFPGPVPRPATTRPGLHLRLTNSEMFTLQITVSKKQTNYFLSASRDWWEDTEPPVCISPPPTSHLTDLLPTLRNITTDIRPEEITRLISGLILAKKSTLSLSSFCAFNLYAPRRFVEGI